MSEDQAQRFFDFLLADDAEELNCSAVVEALHRYVDLQVSGRPMDVLMPGVASHIDACPPCADIYASIASLAQMEAEDRLPPPEQLWAVLRSHTGAVGRSGAAQAIANATGPARPVPVPSGAAMQATSRSSAWLRALRNMPHRTSGWLPIAAGAALVVLAIGWYRADQAADHQTSTMAALSEASTVRMERSPGGAWAQVFFGPASDSVVVHAGDLPPLRSGQTIECWLKRRAGEAVLAAVFAHVNPESEWWVIDADEPVQGYQALALVVNNDGHSESLLEVPLTVSATR